MYKAKNDRPGRKTWKNPQPQWEIFNTFPKYQNKETKIRVWNVENAIRKYDLMNRYRIFVHKY